MLRQRKQEDRDFHRGKKAAVERREVRDKSPEDYFSKLFADKKNPAKEQRALQDKFLNNCGA